VIFLPSCSMGWISERSRQASIPSRLKLIACALSSAIAAFSVLCSGSSATAQIVGHPQEASDMETIRFLVGPNEQTRVVTMRVPKAYFWRPSNELRRLTPLAETTKSTSDAGTFAHDLILEFLLPDFEGRTAGNSEAFREGISGSTIIIEVIPNRGRAEGSNVWGQPLVDTIFRREREMLVTDYDKTKGIVLETKSDRFGLKHEGAVTNFEPYRCGIGNVDDIYYPADDPKQSFVICGAEEIKDSRDDAHSCRRPICSHYFYSRNIQSLIKLRYRRTNLPQWRKLQERTEHLLQSIEKDK